MLLQDKVAVVTGAASGLGKAIALEYLKEGATVIATDINAEKLNQLQQEYSDLGWLYTVVGDVSSKDDDEALINYVYEQFGKLDILVNNAGISDGMFPVDEVTDEMWDKMMAVDLNGPFYLCINHWYSICKYRIIECYCLQYRLPKKGLRTRFAALFFIPKDMFLRGNISYRAALYSFITSINKFFVYNERVMKI